MGLTVAIHQPNFLPWGGYFLKILKSDLFVFLDTAQYTKDSLINRNRIKTPQGAQWLTAPVLTKGRGLQPISAVEINPTGRWREKHLQAFHTNYARAPYFREHFRTLETCYRGAETHIADFNIRLIRSLCGQLQIRTRLFRASELKAEGNGTSRLVNLCREVGADRYICGGGAYKYQEDEEFHRQGIAVAYLHYRCSNYPQLWGEFCENLSFIDMLFNCGPAALQLLQSSATWEDHPWAP